MISGQMNDQKSIGLASIFQADEAITIEVARALHYDPGLNI